MNMTAEDVLFHAFAAISTISALLVVFLSSPIYSALFLALTMSILGALFFMLQGYFISVAQITVYAGAVMVLFVMVIMLFDLKREPENILKFTVGSVTKIFAVALLCGFLVGTSWLAMSIGSANPANTVAPNLKVSDLQKGDGSLVNKAPAPLPPESEEDAKNQVVAQAPDAPALDAMGAVATSAQTDNPDEDLTAAEAAALVEKTAPVKPQEASILQKDEEFGSTISLSRRLFSKYVFAFEAVSILLLIAIVGAVALAKSRGGTHNVAR